MGRDVLPRLPIAPTGQLCFLWMNLAHLPHSTLAEEGENTKVSVETDMKLTGRAAQFGRGIAQDVATKMLDQFAACLEREISGGGTAGGAEAAEPASGNGTAETSTDGQTAPAAAGGTAGRIISSDDPAVAAGGTVEGAVVAGSSPTEAAASAPTTETVQPTTQGDIPRRDREVEEPEAFDIGAAGQEAVLQRLRPVLIGAGVLLVLLWLFRRRR